MGMHMVLMLETWSPHSMHAVLGQIANALRTVIEMHVSTCMEGHLPIMKEMSMPT